VPSRPEKQASEEVADYAADPAKKLHDWITVLLWH